jgi:hypothetical protein
MAIRKIISRSIGVDVIAAEDLAAGSVETAEIQNGAVTGPKLADNLNYDSGTLYLDSTNNRVAIGSTSSLEKLRVAGNIEVLNDDADGYIWFHDAGTRSWAVGSVQSTGKFSINYSSNFSSAERLTIDPNGFTSLNTTTGNERLNVAGAIGSSGASANFGAGDERIIMDYTGSVARVGHVNGASGSAKPLQFLTAGGARMHIDGTGNVGIGLSSGIDGKLHVLGNTVIGDSSTTAFSSFTSGGLDVGVGSGTKAFQVWDDNSTSVPRFTVERGGNLLLNKTSAQAAGDGFFAQPSGVFGFTRSVTDTGPMGYLYNEGATASGFRFLSFRLGAFAEVGTITTNGSSTVSYNTSSDYRLKENVEYDFDATTRLKQLKPARFNFIADADTTVDGFLAHEVQSVVPEAITGTHDEVDDDGNPVYQGIDQGKLVPLLVKTIQELEARITALESN